MGFFGRQKKQSVNGKGNLSMRTGPFDSAKLTPSERENNLLFSSEHSPSETFDLSECDMISIPQGVFSTCKNLRKKSLNLSNNRLCNLGEEDLDRLCGLCELNLENNNFKSLPKDLHKLVNLRILRLTNNPKLSNLKGVETLKKLEELHICETDISALDNCLTSLETLSIIEMGDKATLPIGDHEKTINLIMTAEQHPSELLDLADCGLWKPPKGIYFKCNQLRKRRLIFSKNHLITIYDSNRDSVRNGSEFSLAVPTLSQDNTKPKHSNPFPTLNRSVLIIIIYFNCRRRWGKHCLDTSDS